MTNESSSRPSVSVEAVELLTKRWERFAKSYPETQSHTAYILKECSAELRALLPAQSPAQSPADSLEGVTLAGRIPVLRSFGGAWHVQAEIVNGSDALQEDGSWGSHLSRKNFSDEQRAIAFCLSHCDQPSSGGAEPMTTAIPQDDLTHGPMIDGAEPVAAQPGEQSIRNAKVAHLCKGKSYRNYTRHWCSCCHPDQESVDLSLPELCAVANKTLAAQPPAAAEQHDLPTEPGRWTRKEGMWDVLVAAKRSEPEKLKWAGFSEGDTRWWIFHGDLPRGGWTILDRKAASDKISGAGVEAPASLNKANL